MGNTKAQNDRAKTMTMMPAEETITITRSAYIDAVERIYRGRQAQGTLKNSVDFIMGAAVVFEATGNMGGIPSLWILGPACGCDPITGDPCNATKRPSRKR